MRLTNFLLAVSSYGVFSVGAALTISNDQESAIATRAVHIEELSNAQYRTRSFRHTHISTSKDFPTEWPTFNPSTAPGSTWVPGQVIEARQDNEGPWPTIDPTTAPGSTWVPGQVIEERQEYDGPWPTFDPSTAPGSTRVPGQVIEARQDNEGPWPTIDPTTAPGSTWVPGQVIEERQEYDGPWPTIDPSTAPGSTWVPGQVTEERQDNEGPWPTIDPTTAPGSTWVPGQVIQERQEKYDGSSPTIGQSSHPKSTLVPGDEREPASLLTRSQRSTFVTSTTTRVDTTEGHKAVLPSASTAPGTRWVKIPDHLRPVFDMFSEAEAGPPIKNAEMKCETSDASPWIWDAYDAAKILGKNTGWCYQKNGGGSKCTTEITKGSAAIGFCANWYWSFRCWIIGDIMAWMIDECSTSQDTKVGGWVKSGKGHKFVLFHS